MKGYTDTPYNVSIIGLSALLLGEPPSRHQSPVTDSWYLIRIMNNAITAIVIQAARENRLSIIAS